MPRVFRRCLFPLVCLALAAGCIGEGASHEPAPDVESIARPSPPRAVTTAPAQPEPVASREEDAGPDIVTTAAGTRAYSLRYKYRPDRALYYIIENEFLDHGGVPSLLTFTTKASDRRMLIQRMATTQEPARRSAAKGSAVRLTWECDRYEVREKGMKAEVQFDSLRDSYPRIALRGLGGIPGSKVTFTYDRASRAFGNPRIVQGKIAGPPTHKKLSRTTQKCELNKKNLETLFDALGKLFLPGEPMSVGETWSAQRTNAIKSYGQSVTDYAFTLTEVRERDGRQIAFIDVAGDVHLEKADDATPKRPGAKSAPARGPGAKKKSNQRDFKIDRAVCTGSIEFDITRGELISLVLRRQLDLTAELESRDDRKVALETGSSHLLRVEVRDTPPLKPIIVGGPKPPPPDPVAISKRRDRRRRSTASKHRGAATRPAASKKSAATANKRSIKPRARPAKQPARSKSARPHPRGEKPGSAKKEAARRKGQSQPDVRRGRPRARPTTQPASRPVSDGPAR